MRLRPAPPRRWAVAALSVVTVVVVGAVVRQRDPHRRPLPAVVALPPSAVRHIVVEADGRRAELTRGPGGWSTGPGTPPQSGVLLSGAEHELFPLLAYRRLRADPADPQYGLTEPAAVLRCEDRAGTPIVVRLGAATFSQAGFYARSERDPDRVYLVPRHTLDVLRSLAAGQRVTSADALQARADRARAEQEQAGRDKDVSTYLRQALDAGGQPPSPAP